MAKKEEARKEKDQVACSCTLLHVRSVLLLFLLLSSVFFQRKRRLPEDPAGAAGGVVGVGGRTVKV